MPRDAVADGRLLFEEITSISFVVSGGTNPSLPQTLTRDNFSPFLGSGSAFQQGVRVNPVTGTFLQDFMLRARFNSPDLTPVFIFPHRYVVNQTAAGSGSRGAGGFAVSGGGGNVGVSIQVPGPGRSLLAVLAAALGLLAAAVLRRHRTVRR